MEFQTVYEFTDESLNIDWLRFVFLILFGLGVSFYNIKFKERGSRKRRKNIAFGFIFSGGALLFMIIIVLFKTGAYNRSLEAYEKGEYEVIEGVVENFDPMPYEGHKHESFTVNGVKFEYSDYDETYFGFNQTASHGGPVYQNGQYIRVLYTTINDRNIILKLEIRT